MLLLYRSTNLRVITPLQIILLEKCVCLTKRAPYDRKPVSNLTQPLIWTEWIMYRKIERARAITPLRGFFDHDCATGRSH